MRNLLIISLLYSFGANAQALVSNAGTNITQGDSIPFTLLSGSATGGTPPYTYTWKTLTKPNGNDWCGNILNPTNAATEVLYTGVFSSPFQTAYTYQLKVTDAVAATALDTVTVNVVYSSTPPPTATGSGWHYVTSADSIADPLKQMSPFRKDVWINGANTDNYGVGFKPVTIDIRNAFSVHQDSRVFISAGTYLDITLFINKDSTFATKDHPWRLVPWNGQVTWIDRFLAGGCWKFFVLNGGYDIPNNTGSPLFKGHAGGYAFSSGTYGFWGNNNWRNIDFPTFDFQSCDSTHDGEIKYCEGPNGGSFFLLLGNTSKSSSIYNWKVDNNYCRESQAEMWYLGRTLSDPQQLIDSIQVFNNRNVRSGLEDDQYGQNGQGLLQHHNVFWMSATNWLSPFDANQAFNAQRAYRKNGNIDSCNIWVGSGEQTLSLISNKPSSVTLTSDTNYVKKSVIFNTRGSKDIFIGAQNASAFHYVLDSCYMGYRPHIYLANKIYNSTSNNFSSTSYAILDQQNFSPNITVNYRHIRYDSTGGKTRMDAAGVAGMTYLDTARVNILPPLNFVNSGFIDNTIIPNKLTRWIDTIYNTFKNENNGVTTVFQNSPYTFNVGDYVQHCGWIYLCLQQNQGHPPTGVTDSFWQLITWTKPNGSISKVPPDDLRLPANNFYALQGIGLLDQYTGTYIIIPSGSRIIAH